MTRHRPSLRGESGVVLIATLLVMLLLTALMAGMFAAVNEDLRSHATDRDQTQAYAAAHAGLEKLTSDLTSLFLADVSPSVAQVNDLTNYPPAIDGFAFVAPGGGAGSGYAISFTPDANGNPQILPNSDITAGPWRGLKGLITPYRLTVTARSEGGSEVRLRRDLHTVAVPVFQFGVFSDSDLTFYAGDNFAFGGRVHTNGNLFVSELAGFTLQFSDRITAVKDVVRANFSNGLSVSSNGFTGAVNVPLTIGSPGTYRALKYTPNEGSVLGMPGAAANTNWTSLSVGTYKSNIRTGTTGAKKLELPIVAQGATPIDLIRRPAVNSNEDVSKPAIFGQRYFSMAGVRILLSDRASDLTGLPTITATAPVLLDGDWIASAPNNGAAYGPVDATHPPIARSIGPIANTVTTGSTYASPYTQIRVTGSIANGFKIPTLTVTTVSGARSVTCTGKTQNTFIGCTGITANVSSGAAIIAVLPSGATVSRPRVVR